jgi:RNA polymerase sigma-70 factor, ECF subfamily
VADSSDDAPVTPLSPDSQQRHVDELGDTVYSELRRLAARQLRRERRDHTLQTTALVHEAWMRLAAQDGVVWQNRGHFLAIAATQMRRILIDHARKRHRYRRGGAATRIALDDVQIPAPQRVVDVLDLDEALRALEALDPRASRVVECRYFGGYTTEETAEAVGISTATVDREWRLARGWLAQRLSGERGE